MELSRVDGFSIASLRHERSLMRRRVSGTRGRQSVTPLPCRGRRLVQSMTHALQAVDVIQFLAARLSDNWSAAGVACASPMKNCISGGRDRRGTRVWALDCGAGIDDYDDDMLNHSLPA